MSTAVEAPKLRVVPPSGQATLAKALIAASKDFKPVVKDSKNPHFGNTYASLGAYIDATKPALTAHGLAIVQRSLMEGSEQILETLILHESGETMQAGVFPIRPVKNDPQGVGSALSYARRYSYASALNLASEDDDGSDASKGTPEKKAPVKSDGYKLGASYIAAIMDAAKTKYHGKNIPSKRVMAHLDKIAQGLGASNHETLPEEHVDALIDLIQNGSDPA